MKNANLHSAKVNKNDEFYTQLSDIENELKHYTDFFQGKTVYCNCDNCYESNFFKYFCLNFNRLGLKKLITTCYVESEIAGTIFDLFDDNEDEEKKAYKLELTSIYDANGDSAISMEDVEQILREGRGVTILKGDGDFRSAECLEILKEADVVVTNPPFSLFRDFVSLMVAYDKKFAVLCNNNAITYKEIFPLFKENKLWLGYSSNKTMEFEVPEHYTFKSRNDKGVGIVKVPAISWFTNIPIQKRTESLIENLYKKYSPSDYPKYDNYDAINVDKVADIPVDYMGVMGVPITFLDKYNPDEFGIIGHEHDIIGNGGDGVLHGQFEVNGIGKYKRILIRRK